MKKQRPVGLTELVLIGTPVEVQILTNAAAKSGRLVHTIGPHLMGGYDHRLQVRLFLDPIP